MPIRQSNDDYELVLRAKAGDADSFGGLYDKYAGPIYKYLYVHLGNVEDAEDIAVEVFLRAWQSLPGYDQRGIPFRAYLFRIARNLVIDHYRQRKPAVEVDDQLEDRNLVDLEDGAVKGVDESYVRRALSMIQADYRQILVLRFFGDLSLFEISRVMERSENAVRVLQHRAIKALKKVFVIEVDDEGS